jgi:hypothetical protein
MQPTDQATCVAPWHCNLIRELGLKSCQQIVRGMVGGERIKGFGLAKMKEAADQGRPLH